MCIAITMGDSSGVGPEIILKAFVQNELPDDFIVIGDAGILALCNQQLGYGAHLHTITDVAERQAGVLNVYDLALLMPTDLRIGEVSQKSGHAALCYVERATHLALAQQVSAIVTLPINKEATRLTAPNFSGHTEYIAELCGEENYTMMLASEQLIVTHVSTHISLRQALEQVTTEKVLNIIRLTHEAVARLRPRNKIAVAGLNPHAGENGSFGTEDLTEIKPAIDAARAEGIDANGPFPPDTIFFQTVKGKAYDAVVCMYHDQGHIPMKLLDFEGGINVTLGLPIIRTSVDHGTAFDIAWQGKAFTRSLQEACELAVKLAAEK
ncbi:MAG TPA: 4-hydroxythreonine-4-phosphate dehydrogenase PdxA [Blastocatellia bacterium]|nr:4-hydroxythreonine-4-phosphate dehydrogenase PdxA [Blastocatellia bacterium]